uniref:Zn(2)-C6 fungal-type domain-containing protein n=1 Tax=Bionectria ochroleuca TaxID=29856 RepID=A0A8H7K9V2_BIOOC
MTRPRGCWTCKERKVMCDRSYPECSRCKKSNHKCQGYGVRLSWPNAKSGRAVVGKAGLMPVRPDTRARFINATFWDLEMYHHLSSLSGVHEHTVYMEQMVLKKAPSWSPFQVDDGNETLLDYFNHVAYKTMGIFHQDFEGFRDVILRLAFSDGTPASKAVLQSLLTVSAIQRHGPSLQVDDLKLSALRALKSSSEHGIDGLAGVQQVAAQMLLCSFEVNCAAVTWPWYICGANHILTVANLTKSSNGRELHEIVDWVAYQHVMCRFGLQHWRNGDDYWKLPARKRLGMPTVCTDLTALYGAESPREIVTILSEVVESIQEPSASSYHSAGYADSLKLLENRLETLQSSHSTGAGTADIPADLVELYRLAALIYLERASTRSSGPSVKVQRWFQKAYAILEKQEVYHIPFPLLVLGIESRNDEQRRLFLKLVRQAAVRSGSVAMENVHRMIQSVWLQDDLETERVLDYRLKLRAVFSSSEILPSLA